MLQYIGLTHSSELILMIIMILSNSSIQFY
nr:MAG TPA: hypothetical protein [Caudoviricetes sp.]